MKMKVVLIRKEYGNNEFSEKYYNAVQWICENIEKNNASWTRIASAAEFHFKNESDAILFKLIWG